MHKFHPSVLKAYDIRGIVGDTINDVDAYNIGRAFASILKSKNKSKVTVGYDGRLSSPDLKDNLVRGLIDSGINVLEIGRGPTPMLYFSVYHLGVDAGIMVTGSHNPPTHNGFKFILADSPFYGDDILKLGKIAELGNFVDGNGEVSYVEVMEDYVTKLASDCDIKSESELLDEVDDFLEDKKRQLKISWDVGNGATGEVIQKLIKKIKASHFLLFEEIDGSFPNHHPDPTVVENLKDLKKSVLENSCDLGIAFDGDGDRIGVLDDEGEVLWGDQLMCLFSKDVLSEYPGSTIISDVKASQVLFDDIAKNGGKPLMWKTGHSLIKAKMKEISSPLAGEMSGHIFFADRYYGFDDAIYAAIRIINIVLKSEKKLSEIRKSFPKTFSTPEIRIRCDDEKKFLIVKNIANQLKAEKLEFNDVDGVRINNKDGWWLLRASNTEAFLVARCESLSPEGLVELKKDLSKRLEANNIKIPQGLC
ncbi:MAG: phosphomannomutase [Rickettsiaceae bacterium]|jgi:phosphomannomutase|nr:phosphomannomutase [Rickettsiaceae bacterium]